MTSPNPTLTALLKLPSPVPADPPDIPGDLKALADRVDAVAAKVRRVNPTASGNLPVASGEITYGEMLLPDPFDGADYVLTFGAMGQFTVPAQGGVEMRLFAGGAQYGMGRYTNAGTTPNQITMTSTSGSIVLAGAVTCRVTIKALAYDVTVSSDAATRYLYAMAVPGRQW